MNISFGYLSVGMFLHLQFQRPEHTVLQILIAVSTDEAVTILGQCSSALQTHVYIGFPPAGSYLAHTVWSLM